MKKGCIEPGLVLSRSVFLDTSFRGKSCSVIEDCLTRIV